MRRTRRHRGSSPLLSGRTRCSSGPSPSRIRATRRALASPPPSPAASSPPGMSSPSPLACPLAHPASLPAPLPTPGVRPGRLRGERGAEEAALPGAAGAAAGADDQLLAQPAPAGGDVAAAVRQPAQLRRLLRGAVGAHPPPLRLGLQRVTYIHTRWCRPTTGRRDRVFELQGAAGTV